MRTTSLPGSPPQCILSYRLTTYNLINDREFSTYLIFAQMRQSQTKCIHSADADENDDDDDDVRLRVASVQNT